MDEGRGHLMPAILMSELPDLPGLAHNPWELATWGIIGLVAVIAFWIWTTRTQIKGVARELNDVHEHTVNTHKTNMRNDIDDTKDAAQAALKGVDQLIQEVQEWRKDIGGIREELRADRAAHHDNVQRIDRRLDSIERRMETKS